MYDVVQETIQVIYACDDTYAMLAGVSMESLFASNQKDEALVVHILCNRVSRENKEKLAEIGKSYQREVVLMDVDNELIQFCEAQIDPQKWSLAAFIRLFVPQLLPELHRVLYLDCDTIVLGAVRPLWNTDMQGLSCAAVSEPMSAWHKKNLHMKKDSAYFNSGVMIIDLDQWREKRIITDFAACIEAHSGRVPYVDQGVINEVLCGQIAKLPEKYNVRTDSYDYTYSEMCIYRANRSIYSEEEVNEAKKNPVIVHYTSSYLTPRPWIEHSTHPYAKQWDIFLSKTPWRTATKWKDNPDSTRRLLRFIFRHTPRGLGLRIACVANSYIRAVIEK